MDGGRPVESSQLAEILQALASLHRNHQETLLELRQDQDRRFVKLMHAQAEDRQAIRSLLSQGASSAATPDTPTPLPPPALQKMRVADDPEAFLDLFERTAEIWGWPLGQWAARLIPLLSGEAQLAAQQLPASSLLAYGDLKKAILQRVGRIPEESRQLFRSLKLESSDRPFAFAQRLRDACRRWLLAGDRDVQGIIDQVVLEQFIVRLPKGMAEWVQCHRPASLEEAIRLAEDHMAAIPRTEDPSYLFSPPSVSSPSPLSPSSALSPGPVPAPRRRGGTQPLWEATPSPTPMPHRSPLQGGAHADASAGVAPGPACWRCGDPSHFRDQCPLMELGMVVRVSDLPQAAPDQAGAYRIPVSVKGGTHQALVDTGCNQTTIHQRLVQPKALVTSKTVKVKCVHGDIHKYPVVTLTIKFRGKKHRVEAAVSSRLTHPLILGTDWPDFRVLLKGICADGSCVKMGRCVMCDALAGEAELGPSSTAPRHDDERGGEAAAPPLLREFPEGDFPLEQSRDETLKHAFDQVRVIDGQGLQPDIALSYPYFAIINERLYRVTQDTRTKEDTTQLLVFQAAHYNPMAGHLGERKTLNRLIARFYWPGIGGDVRRWCAACRECQLVNPPATPKAPLRPLPLIEVPFERIGMDLVGPLERSARGHRFVLVLVDYATRYPEAVPLCNISARSVAEALFKIISRVGIPKEILTDQGTTFMSRTLRELYELLNIKSIHTSVYHPQTDGLVERFNKTLKNMIRKFVHDDSRNWDKWLDPLLFAVREVPQASTGFSPFKLLYGQRPRGMLDVM
ncbi:uncharacterized protein LOC127415117 [Myxocyprinus asiaticus]|uniref:uncharacterized protein LOC127415117 n=1 Tax=Myxocyprinus asiaticus TaxID=70543 RepID=UPI00222184B1|nr:uncharacterized protein LOC127415117 [Myxocyprinus asiaticus]